MRDPVGSDLPDKAEAMEEALRSAQEMASNLVRTGECIPNLIFEIFDEQGSMVGVVPLQSAVKLAP